MKELFCNTIEEDILLRENVRVSNIRITPYKEKNPKQCTEKELNDYISDILNRFCILKYEDVANAKDIINSDPRNNDAEIYQICYMKEKMYYYFGHDEYVGIIRELTEGKDFNYIFVDKEYCVWIFNNTTQSFQAANKNAFNKQPSICVGIDIAKRYSNHWCTCGTQYIEYTQFEYAFVADGFKYLLSRNELAMLLKEESFLLHNV